MGWEIRAGRERGRGIGQPWETKGSVKELGLERRGGADSSSTIASIVNGNGWI